MNIRSEVKPVTAAIVISIAVIVFGGLLYKFAQGKTFTKEEASGGMSFKIPGAPNATEGK